MAFGYDPQHFAALFAVEDRHFWFGARNLALATVIRSLSPHLPAPYRALEIGCGTGNTLRMLKQACVGAEVIVGMDLFAEGLRYARQRAAVPLVQARIEQAPFAVPFDLVGMFDVLEHIPDDVEALTQVRRLTKRGGYLVLTVPAHQRLWSRFDEESHHCRRYEVSQLQERLERADLAIEYVTPFMASLYPLARISRWLAARANGLRRRMNVAERSAVLDELRVVPVVNEIVGFMLRCEVGALERRRRLPMGTSLLAVARAH